MRPKSDLLNNIELLWNEASMQSQKSANQKAASTFQRINLLMQDALQVEEAANDAVANAENAASHDAVIKGSPSKYDQGWHNQDRHDQDRHNQGRQNTLDQDIDKLAGLVHDAADHHDGGTTEAPSQQPFDQVMSQMDDVSRLKPPQEDHYNIAAVEYDFGQAFTNLVRHVVRDYIHNEVETVIRNAISSELNAHFANQHDQTHDGEDKK